MSEPRPRAPVLSIVVPVYNGARTIRPLVEALARLAIPGGHELVLVNDGSRDDSRRVCTELVDTASLPITLVDLARNFGEHNAVMAGLHHARGDYVITMDDDLQNPPEEVARLLQHAQEEGHDVVYTRYATKRHAAWRNLGSRFANWCSDLLLDKPRGLYLSSFRCLSRFTVDAVCSHRGPFPYVDGLILQVTHDIGTLEVAHLPRAVGRSNYSLRRLVRLWLAMIVGFSVMPLRASTLVGAVMGVLGLLGFLIIVIEALAGETPPGYASLMSATLLLAGIQLVMLGLIGEYLGRLFLTVNGKPQYRVRSVHRRAPGSGEPPAC